MPVHDDVVRVDPYGVIPKYHQLRAILLRKIETGEWRPHDAIPSERELQGLYGLSRTTIREALELLEADGNIYRSQGRGTFVAPPKLQYSTNTLSSFHDDMRMRGMAPGQRILFMGREAPNHHVRQQLRLPDEVEHVQCIKRVRLADGEPIGIHTTYLSLPPGVSITPADLEAYGSLYALLTSHFGFTLAEGDQTFEATLATPEEAALLNISPGNPLLLMERLVVTDARQPLEFTKMLHRADRYRYVVRLKR